MSAPADLLRFDASAPARPGDRAIDYEAIRADAGRRRALARSALLGRVIGRIVAAIPTARTEAARPSGPDQLVRGGR